MTKTRGLRGITLVIALVVLITAAIGGTYMWFFAQTGAISGDGNAAKINLNATAATIKFDKVLPGEEIKLGSSTLNYDGTRPAILKLSFTDAKLTAKLAGNPDPALAADYVQVGSDWFYTQTRLDQIVALTIDLSKAPVDFYQVPNTNTYYALVTPTDTANLLTGVSAKFTGEFGGNYVANKSAIPPVPSVSRQFEQETEFDSFGLSASVVQVTQEAVTDVWGAASLAEINALPGLIADINGNTDAISTWNNVG